MLDSYYYDYSTIPDVSTTTETAQHAAEVLAAAAAVSFVVWVIVIALAIFVLIARWKMFKKANFNGWESLIPIHGDIAELQMGGVSTAVWFLNLIVLCGIGPILFVFWKNIALAKAFGKGTFFGILLVFVPVIAYPILGFGKAEYVGANNSTTNSQNTEA